ncbi:hypothetical protein JOB18_043266 [Solea senegalensis]|uniref:Uncharacterized protein n=1 Tax=Solea senegalensis TaxID=28829 RepID=A0AAV6S4L4_SOLSE|nr:hypothetical protein JOB18_043266 [Solea senegalensis]
MHRSSLRAVSKITSSRIKTTRISLWEPLDQVQRSRQRAKRRRRVSFLRKTFTTGSKLSPWLSANICSAVCPLVFVLEPSSLPQAGAQSGSMPVFILLRSLVIRLLSSRLAGSVAQFLRRSLSTGAAHLGTALRHVWDRIRSQESKEAVLGCVLCLLNMHKKVEN